MEERLAVGLTAIVVLGVGGQWLAAKLRIPAIIILLGAGVVAGPVTGVVDPTELFGDLLFPMVSLAVGVLLFEGGLGLRIEGLRHAPDVVLRLVTVGVVVTWLIGTVAAIVLLDLEVSIAALLAAVLVVSGPTVVLPLLRQARPRPTVRSILKWEGIVIDPIGAALAVVVLHRVLDPHSTILRGALDLAVTTVVGVAVGSAAAVLLVWALRSFAVPDPLHNPVTLLFVLASFTVANEVASEAGLFATTTLGIALANQHWAPTSHIAEFQEDLGPLILAGLFVLLGARIDLDAVADVAPGAVGLALVLLLIARPLAVWLSTIGSGLDLQERAFLSFLAPRGIVAASVSSLFALHLLDQGLDPYPLVPATFTVIATTVVVVGLGAKPLARWLGVAEREPRGVALVGSGPWVLALAHELAGAGVRVLVVSPDGVDADDEVGHGVDVYDGNLANEAFIEALEHAEIGHGLAVSRNEALNALAVGRLVEALGRARVFHLPPDQTTVAAQLGVTRSAWGRRPFSPTICQLEVQRQLDAGARLSTLGASHGPVPADATALFRIDADGRTYVHQGGPCVTPRGGRTIALIAPPPRGRSSTPHSRTVGSSTVSARRTPAAPAGRPSPGDL